MPLLKDYRARLSRFHQKHIQKDPHFFEKKAKSQKPKTLIIACSDSRIDPALLFDLAPGQSLMIRNAAAWVPPYQKNLANPCAMHAILRLGVHLLDIPDVIVLGHTSCAGVDASEAPAGTIPSEIAVWASQYQRKNIESPFTSQLENTVHASWKNLTTYPWIQEKLANGTIKTHAWYYDIANCQIIAFDPHTKTFNA